MWLYIVASNPLSIAYPVAVGLITIFTAVGSFVVTRDGYTPWHAVGAALVISGVTVLAFAGSNGT
jgi:multidrug transporter EmrE-like cation transporter